MSHQEMDQRVFGPYYGTPPEQHTNPEPPLYPPEPRRTERRTRFLTRRRWRRPTSRP